MKNSLSRTIISSFPYLIVLYECCHNKNVLHALLQRKTVINSLSEIIFNLLKKNIEIPKSERRKFKKIEKYLFQLAKKRGKKEKVQILSGQKGGAILSSVLSAALPQLIQITKNNGSTKNRKQRQKIRSIVR